MSIRNTTGTSLRLLQRYLTASGWEKTRPGTKYSLYLHKEIKDLELLLANSEDVRGWEISIRDALETLADLHEKPLEKMAEEIRTISYDVIRAALPDSLMIDDSIDLDLAAAFINRSRRLLATSATAEILQTQYFPKTRKKGEQYANSCRFGHTFRGSFGFILESPLKADQQQLIEDSSPVPFERRVVERFVYGLSLIEEAARIENSDILVENYKKGWNANVCDEFVKLREAVRGASVKFSLAWSREIKPRTDIVKRESYEISAKEMELVQDAAIKLRQRQEKQIVTVVGPVIELRAEHISGTFTAAEGDVVVRWISEEYGNLKVHMTLPRDWYWRAIIAHERVETVVANGVLEKDGRHWRLKDITTFEISD
jgi:hypothetical protein